MAPPARPTSQTRSAGQSFVWPWMSETEVANWALTYAEDASDDLFHPGGKVSVTSLLTTIRDKLAAGDAVHALGDVGRLLATVVTNVRNDATREEMLLFAGNLRGAIIQAIQNSPPVAVASDDQHFEVTSGAHLRVTLMAQASSDPDSTPGTDDNIRWYRWYEAGMLLAEGEKVAVTLGHDPASGVVTTHTITLEVEDAYGALSTDQTVITLAKRP